MDREEFFRLKKIQSKKKRDTAAREKEDAEKRRVEEGAKYGNGGGGRGGDAERVGSQPEPVGDLLQDKDEDGAS